MHQATIDNYGLSVSTEPQIEPVSLKEMKDWLRVSHDDEDGMIGALIHSARVQAETITRRSLINRTLVQTHEDFPSGDRLILRASPVSSVTSVAYTDQNGDSQTFSSANYRVVTDRPRPYIRLVSSADWPIVQTDNDTAVQITMVAGFGVVRTSVPDNMRIAIQMIVAYAYENRGDARPVVRLAQAQQVIDTLLGPSWIVEF